MLPHLSCARVSEARNRRIRRRKVEATVARLFANRVLGLAERALLRVSVSAASHLLLADERVAADNDITVRIEVMESLFALLLGPQSVALLEKVLPLVAVGVSANRFARAALEAMAKLERVCLRFALVEEEAVVVVSRNDVFRKQMCEENKAIFFFIQPKCTR